MINVWIFYFWFEFRDYFFGGCINNYLLRDYVLLNSVRLVIIFFSDSVGVFEVE